MVTVRTCGHLDVMCDLQAPDICKIIFSGLIWNEISSAQKLELKHCENIIMLFWINIFCRGSAKTLCNIIACINPPKKGLEVHRKWGLYNWLSNLFGDGKMGEKWMMDGRGGGGAVLSVCLSPFSLSFQSHLCWFAGTLLTVLLHSQHCNRCWWMGWNNPLQSPSPAAAHHSLVASATAAAAAWLAATGSNNNGNFGCSAAADDMVGWMGAKANSLSFVDDDE